jgi:flavin-dependent dehydrogenase
MAKKKGVPMASKQEVTIYGAGMSGLIAAINLAREGYAVTVHDREKGYGGDPMYNPSTHTTPILPQKVSDYIGIDITPCFKPVIDCPFYFHDTVMHFPVSGMYTVERGPRESSLDTLLYKQAVELGVTFEWKSPLRKQDVASLAPGTIIACGLTTEVYEMLNIPHRKWYGWISRGECGFDGLSWIWFDEEITEYGYLSSVNNYYFDLLFSINPVSKQTLEKYKEAIKRHQGVEHDNWQPGGGAVPVADPSNPQLIRGGNIYCGTIAGSMDPMGWFGITGAIISGKIATMAVTDPEGALREQARFAKDFNSRLFIKDKIWYPHVRPYVGRMEKSINLIGAKRIEKILAAIIREDRHLPIFGIQGFAHIGTCY